MGPFEADPEISTEEWVEIRSQEKSLREKIDFEALLMFVIAEAEIRKGIKVGEENDLLVIDFANNLPKKEWDLTFPRELIFTSGKWSWRYTNRIIVTFTEGQVYLAWEIERVAKDEFKIIGEEIDDDRDTLY